MSMDKRRMSHVLLIDPAGNVCKVPPAAVKGKLAEGWSDGKAKSVKPAEPKPQ